MRARKRRFYRKRQKASRAGVKLDLWYAKIPDEIKEALEEFNDALYEESERRLREEDYM